MSGEKLTVRGTQLNVPIDGLAPNPWNPNVQTDFIYEKERVSIRTFGFIDPCLVREVDGNYQIIDGEHRWRAAKEEGLKEISVITLGEIPDEVAQQLTIIMNETRGRPDEQKMARLVAELKESVGMEVIMERLPYSEMELETMIAKSAVNWEEIESEVRSPAAKEEIPKIEYEVGDYIKEEFEKAVKRVQKIGKQGELLASEAHAIEVIAMLINGMGEEAISAVSDQVAP